MDNTEVQTMIDEAINDFLDDLTVILERQPTHTYNGFYKTDVVEALQKYAEERKGHG